MNLPNPLNFLVGYKTYIAAIGLAAMGILAITNGNIPGGISLLSQALAAAGIRSAIANTPAPPTTPTAPVA